MDTKVDVEALKISLRSRGFDVEISTDPGRFVCNWT